MVGCTRKALALVGMLLCIGAGPVSADILVEATPDVSNFAIGQFQWSYDVSLAANQAVFSGDFFTIYDVAGFISATAPANWVAVPFLIGVTPAGTSPSDDPGLFNVTYQYTGIAPLVVPGPIGTFNYISSLNTGANGDFASQGTNTVSGLPEPNQGTTLVAAVLPPAATPEPGSLLLFGAGIAGIVRYGRRRKKSEAQEGAEA